MEDMLDYIRKYPEMVLDAIEATKRAHIPVLKFDRVVVCGMGGSAVGGDFIVDTLRAYGIRLHAEVSRRYELPTHVGKGTLIIISSYSGETEETLSQFAEARRRGLQVICMSSGGRLKKWAENFGIPFVELPGGFKPRATLPYSLFTVIEYLREAGKLDLTADIDEAVQVLTDLRNDRGKDNEMMSLAGLMSNNRICVYGSEAHEAATRRMKNQINENGKLPASWDVFPEMNHNEIVGFEDNDLNKENYVIILRDPGEHPAVRARIEATKNIIRGKVMGVAEIWTVGKSALAKDMSLAFMGDLLSCYLAMHGKKNVDKTANIDSLKAALREELNLQEKIEKELI
ncbi:MAG: bifunctional phosphoglucose/phosphomannose isomerase [Candidatus Aenigmatarchaeota archaeon]